MFRFTIRDVLWLTVVVALGVGWWVTAQKAQKAHVEAEILRRNVAPLEKAIRGLQIQNEMLMQQATAATAAPPPQ